MAAEGEKLGEIFVAIRADFAELKKDMSDLKKDLKKDSSEMSKSFDDFSKESKHAFDGINTTAKELQERLIYLRNVLKTNAKDSKAYAIASREINSVLNELGRTTEETGKKAKKSLVGWALGITAVNQAYEFLRSTWNNLKTTINESISASTGLEVLRANFQGTTQDLELFKKATADTVGEANLIKLSNQATDLGISLKQQALLFALAEDAGDKYGAGVEEGMQRIIQATEGNVRGLKFLGIQKEVYEKNVIDLARAQGTEIDNLDAETQKQIRLEAIIKASGITIDDVNNKVKDSSDKYKSLSVRVEEAKVKLGDLIAKGLLPAIDAFDKSGKTGKDFVSVILGVGTVAFNLMPILVQLKTAQALLATTTAASTTALDANSVALGTNAAAGAGWLTKFGFAIFAGIGVAIGVGAGKLIDYIKYDLPEEINKASEEAANKLKKVEGDKVLSFLNSNTRFVPGKGIIKLVDDKNLKSSEQLASQILKNIEALETANKSATISISDYRKNLVEIERLQKLITPATKSELNDKINQAIAKNKITIEQAELLNKAKLEVLQIAQQNLEELLKTTTAEQKRLTILKEIKSISDEIKNIQAGINEGLFNSLQGKTADSLFNDLSNKKPTESRNQSKNLQGERLNALKDLGNSEIGQKGIKDEYEREKALTNKYYDDLLKKYSESEGERLKLTEEFAQARFEIEQARSVELAELWKENYADAFSTAADIINRGMDQIRAKASTNATAMEQMWVDIANIAIQQIQRILAEWLMAQALKFIFSLATGGAGAAVPVGATGGVFKGSSNGVKKMAGGGSFRVPDGFSNDTYPMLLSSKEVATVQTPAQVNASDRYMKQMVGRMDVMNNNLLEMSMRTTKIEGSIAVTGKYEGGDIYLSNRKATKRKGLIS